MTRKNKNSNSSNTNSLKKAYNAVPEEVKEEAKIISEIAGIQAHVYNGNGHHKQKHKWIGDEFNPKTLGFSYTCHECGVTYPNKEICVIRK